MKTDVYEIAVILFILYLMMRLLNRLRTERSRDEPDRSDMLFYKRFARGEKMVRIVATTSVLDVSFLECLFRAEGIGYTIFNRCFGRLYPGPFIDNYNTITFIISSKDYKRCIEVMRRYFVQCKKRRKIGLGKIRNIVEYIAMGWFIPNTGYLGNIFILDKR